MALTISISAIIFGLVHYGGTPNGVFGVVAAGVLGWILAKSVVETKGMAWALLIHFLQDTTHMARFFIRRLNRL